MPNKMLIDATHPEETRVVVLRGNRVEEFDFESANRKQLRGNIYLAKVTRVEPSLQAAFVDYGGNRHGFLAFSEIHPDYYQIPVADRQALIAEEEREQRAADAEADHRAGRRAGRPPRTAGTPPARRGQDRTRRNVRGRNARGRSRHHGGRLRADAAGSRRVRRSRTYAAPPPKKLDWTTRPPRRPRRRPQVESPEHRRCRRLPTLRSICRRSAQASRFRRSAKPNAWTSPTAGEPAAAEADEAPHQSEEGVTTAPADDTAAETSEANGAGENGHNITEVNGNGAEGEEEVDRIGRRRRRHGGSAGTRLPLCAGSTRSRK